MQNLIHQRLCVDYAEYDIGERQSKTKKVENEDLTEQKYFKNFMTKLHSFNHSVGFHQPPPPHLKYEYPKANKATINNIAHALATIPKFYVQVLHLMNRMNLPPPFAMENPPIIQQNAVVNRNIQQPQKAKTSSESELESDEESEKRTEYIPQKRTAAQSKAIKRPKFIKPNIKPVSNDLKHSVKNEDVFEKIDLHNRKIEVNVSGESLNKKDFDDDNRSNGNSVKESDVDQLPKSGSISDEELRTNQIPLKDLGVLPVFKNYHAGVPSARIYIKNIAKTVKMEDLEYIFSRYKMEESGDKNSEYNIRLMQEGRMKGQAFVTLDSISLAKKAVEETNGFILKDKPLVVVFARGSTNKNN